uniref:Protein kinase domain-containing protein n=1 Tax=Macrostomum lignano TaxID=282301 RepID=A0A1I8FKJ0_9PLAT
MISSKKSFAALQLTYRTHFEDIHPVDPRSAMVASWRGTSSPCALHGRRCLRTTASVTWTRWSANSRSTERVSSSRFEPANAGRLQLQQGVLRTGGAEHCFMDSLKKMAATCSLNLDRAEFALLLVSSRQTRVASIRARRPLEESLMHPVDSFLRFFGRQRRQDLTRSSEARSWPSNCGHVTLELFRPSESTRNSLTTISIREWDRLRPRLRLPASRATPCGAAERDDFLEKTRGPPLSNKPTRRPAAPRTSGFAAVAPDVSASNRWVDRLLRYSFPLSTSDFSIWRSGDGLLQEEDKIEGFEKMTNTILMPSSTRPCSRGRSRVVAIGAALQPAPPARQKEPPPPSSVLSADAGASAAEAAAGASSFRPSCAAAQPPPPKPAAGLAHRRRCQPRRDKATLRSPPESRSGVEARFGARPSQPAPQAALKLELLPCAVAGLTPLPPRPSHCEAASAASSRQQQLLFGPQVRYTKLPPPPPAPLQRKLAGRRLTDHDGQPRAGSQVEAAGHQGPLPLVGLLKLLAPPAAPAGSMGVAAGHV